MSGADETPGPAAVVSTVTRARSDRSPRVAAQPVGAVLLSIAILATSLAACASSGAPTWTFAPVPPLTTKPQPVAATCPPGSTPDEPGPVDQVRPVQDSPTAMAFDRRAGRLVALTSALTGTETWTFDVCSNTWTQMHPNQEPAGVDEWTRFVYDVDSDTTIVVGRNTGDVWAYELHADTWTEKGLAPAYMALFAYDPVSGLVVATDDSDPMGMWLYDVDADTWTRIRQANGPGYAEFAYDASVDRVVAYAGGTVAPETWLLDIRTGTWRRSDTVTPAIVAGWGLPHTIVYDEAAERTAIVSNSGLAAYEATADRWELVIGGEPGSVPDVMAYDPVNRRLVATGPGQVLISGHIVSFDVVAFDLVTREWTVLLEPGGG